MFCVVGVEKGKNFLFALLGGKRGKVRLFESLPPTGEKFSPVVCTAPLEKGRLYPKQLQQNLSFQVFSGAENMDSLSENENDKCISKHGHKNPIPDLL